MQNQTYDSVLSNITELIGREDLLRTVTQCGKIMDGSSDYELFRIFCELQPMLKEHRLVSRCYYYLETIIGYEAILCSENCDEIWEKASEYLLQNPTLHNELPTVPSYWATILFEDMVLTDDVFKWDSNYSATPLVFTKAASYEKWTKLIEEQLDLVIAEKETKLYQKISYRLPRRYEDCVPNPYIIGHILKKEKKSISDINLLYAQFLRILFAFCVRYGIPLILYTSCDAKSLLSLITRLKKEVGCPTLECIVSNREAAETVFDLAAKDPNISLSMAQKRNESDIACQARLSEYAKDYPSGRISLYNEWLL